MYKASSAFVSTQIKFCSPILSAKKSCFSGWKGMKDLWSQLDKSSNERFSMTSWQSDKILMSHYHPENLTGTLTVAWWDNLFPRLLLIITFSRSLFEIEVVAMSDWHCGYKPMWVLKESAELENTWLYACVPRYFNCPLQNWPDSSRSQDDQGIKWIQSRWQSHLPLSWLTGILEMSKRFC